MCSEVISGVPSQRVGLVRNGCARTDAGLGEYQSSGSPLVAPVESYPTQAMTMAMGFLQRWSSLPELAGMPQIVMLVANSGLASVMFLVSTLNPQSPSLRTLGVSTTGPPLVKKANCAGAFVRGTMLYMAYPCFSGAAWLFASATPTCFPGGQVSAAPASSSASMSAMVHFGVTCGLPMKPGGKSTITSLRPPIGSTISPQFGEPPEANGSLNFLVVTKLVSKRSGCAPACVAGLPEASLGPALKEPSMAPARAGGPPITTSSVQKVGSAAPPPSTFTDSS